MAGISNEAILLKKDYQFKGALAENYCLQQLRSCFDVLPKYYVQGQNSEIDFLLEEGMNIVPVEVKAGEAVHANSFKKYIEKQKPEIALRYSALGFKTQEKVINIPLYLVGKTREIITGR